MTEEDLKYFEVKSSPKTLWGQYTVLSSPNDFIFYNPNGDLITLAYRETNNTYDIEYDPYGLEFSKSLKCFGSIEQILSAMPSIASILIKNVDILIIEKISLNRTVIRILEKDFSEYILPNMKLMNV